MKMVYHTSRNRAEMSIGAYNLTRRDIEPRQQQQEKEHDEIMSLNFIIHLPTFCFSSMADLPLKSKVFVQTLQKSQDRHKISFAFEINNKNTKKVFITAFLWSGQICPSRMQLI